MCPIVYIWSPDEVLAKTHKDVFDIDAPKP